MKTTIISFLKQTGFALGMALLTFNAQAQDADISKMGHFKLRGYLKENGFKTQKGAVVHVGDELKIGAGSRMDKRFEFIYQSPQGIASGSSYDGEIKAYLTSNARGRKARVKSFMTSGMKRGQFSIYTVVGVGELDNYWIELDNAIEAGEIILNK